MSVVCNWQNDQKVFSCGKEESNSVFEEAKIKARELKIGLKISDISPQTLAVCEEDPINNLFISVDCQVAPCVYLHPPIPSTIRRIYRGNDSSIEKTDFWEYFCGAP